MKSLFKKTISFSGILFILIFLNLFMFLRFEKAISKPIKPSVYIIENNNSTELLFTGSDIYDYEIVSMNIENLSSNKTFKTVLVNDKFLIYDKLENGNEYKIKVELINKTTNENSIFEENFKYVKHNINVKNVYENYCNVNLSYDRKNSILIDSVEIYSNDGEINEFKARKYSSEISSYRNSIEFKHIGLSPNTSYDIYGVIKMKNNINIVSKTKVKSKSFEILDLKSSMVSNKKIKLSWKVSNENIKLVNKDSINIYVKKIGEGNFPITPIVKITESDVLSTVIDTGKISSKYEIRVEYNLAGVQYEKYIEQDNNFYTLNSKINVSNLRNEKVSFGFNSKNQFIDNEILNVYLVDKSNEDLQPVNIYSNKILNMPPLYNITLNLENLIPDRNYKIIYEILFKDGNNIVVKEDEFKTNDFKLRKVNVTKSKDKYNNTKVNLKWNIENYKFKFAKGDTLAVYIKKKESPNYLTKPYVFKDNELDKTFSLDIDIDENVVGKYDIKLVYNIGGKEYTTYNDLDLEDNSTSYGIKFPFFPHRPSKKPVQLIKPSEGSSTTLPENQQGSSINDILFKSTIKDTKANEVILEFTYDDKLKFSEGDKLLIYKKVKEGNEDYKLHSEYVHSEKIVEEKPDSSTQSPETNEPHKDPEPEQGTAGQSDGTGSGSSGTQAEGSSTQSPNEEIKKKFTKVDDKNPQSQLDKIEKINISKLKTLTISNLTPNKKYEFKVVIINKEKVIDPDKVKEPSDDNESSQKDPKPKDEVSRPQQGSTIGKVEDLDNIVDTEIKNDPESDHLKDHEENKDSQEDDLEDETINGEEDQEDDGESKGDGTSLEGDTSMEPTTPETPTPTTPETPSGVPVEEGNIGIPESHDDGSDLKDGEDLSKDKEKENGIVKSKKLIPIIDLENKREEIDVVDPSQEGEDITDLREEEAIEPISYKNTLINRVNGNISSSDDSIEVNTSSVASSSDSASSSTSDGQSTSSSSSSSSTSSPTQPSGSTQNGEVITGGNGKPYVRIVTLEAETKKFEILTLVAESIKANTAVLKWTLNDESINFNKDDKLEIYAKRKIVGGYPAGNSFEKVGKEMQGVLSGQIALNSMNMEYTVKLVYTISNVKYEKIMELTTLGGTTSCSVSNINEYSATLNVVYPEGYKFFNGDRVEIYVKEANMNVFSPIPVMDLTHENGVNNIEETNTFNLYGLQPKMDYDVLVKFANKSNDIPNCTTKFITTPLILENCIMKKVQGNKFIIKTSMKNDLEILDYLQLYLDVFYKPTSKDKYLDVPLATASGANCLETEIELPDLYTDYDILASFNPHGFFNDTLFIEFEHEYRTIRGVVDTTTVEENGSTINKYDLKWAYPKSINFTESDKINIYIKEIGDSLESTDSSSLSEDNSEEKSTLNRTSEEEGAGAEEGSEGEKEEIKEDNSDVGYNKIHTIDSNLEGNTSFSLDYYVNESKNYNVIVELESSEFKVGPGKINFKTLAKPQETEKEEEKDDIIFDVPIQVEDFSGTGDTGNFKLPDLGNVVLDDKPEIYCDIQGLSLEYENENSEIKIKGLVPGKTYPKIEIKIKVEEGKEIVFNIENIKLQAEDNVQTFLFNTYQRAFVRDPDEGGYHYWINRLKEKDITARNFVINLLFSEKEFSQMDYTTDELISVLYSIVVDREPDQEGLGFWIKFYNEEALVLANKDVFVAKQYIVDRMINESEFKKLILGFGLDY